MKCRNFPLSMQLLLEAAFNGGCMHVCIFLCIVSVNVFVSGVSTFVSQFPSPVVLLVG